jgi:hypothetical protein
MLGFHLVKSGQPQPTMGEFGRRPAQQSNRGTLRPVGGAGGNGFRGRQLVVDASMPFFAIAMRVPDHRVVADHVAANQRHGKVGVPGVGKKSIQCDCTAGLLVQTPLFPDDGGKSQWLRALCVFGPHCLHVWGVFFFPSPPGK